jgi:hypothetical protein
MQVRIANPRAGGSAKSFLMPKLDALLFIGGDHFVENFGHATHLRQNNLQSIVVQESLRVNSKVF